MKEPVVIGRVVGVDSQSFLNTSAADNLQNNFVEGCSAMSTGFQSSFDVELSQLLCSTTENVPADDPLK